MTVYPNLPKFLPQSPTSNHGVKTSTGPHQQPAKAMSVIHETKVVTPPQGYLPSLLLKPGNKPPQPLRSSSSIKQSGNDLVTHLKSAPISNNNKNNPAASVYHQPGKQPALPSVANKTAFLFTPFTIDDISPLNFFIHPHLAHVSTTTTTERIAPDLQHLHQPHRDQLVEQSAHVPSVNHHLRNQHIPHVPLKSMDFRWNVSAPPSEWYRSAQQKQQQPPAKEDGPASSAASSHQVLKVPGDGGEIVVRTKMAAFGSSSNNNSTTVGTDSSGHDSESIEIITGYIEDDHPSSSSSNGSKSFVQYGFQQPSVSSVQHDSSPSIVGTHPSTASPDLTSSASSPKLHGDFLPMLHQPHHHSHHQPAGSEAVAVTSAPTEEPLSADPKFMEEVPAPVLAPFRPTPALDDDDVFAVPQSPDLFEDQQVADSQIHETTAYENLPHVVSVKPSDSVTGKSSLPFFYKPGKLSPKGAMYTWNGNVYEGHSKVKFFGFNALHGAEMKYQDGKYVLFQGSEPVGWRFSPYLPVKVPSTISPAVKVVPKKSVPISASSGKSPIRPVFFAKRTPEAAGDDHQPAAAAAHLPSPAGSIISDPFEYHAHLQKMAEDRLPSQPPPS